MSQKQLRHRYGSPPGSMTSTKSRNATSTLLRERSTSWYCGPCMARRKPSRRHPCPTSFVSKMSEPKTNWWWNSRPSQGSWEQLRLAPVSSSEKVDILRDGSKEPRSPPTLFGRGSRLRLTPWKQWSVGDLVMLLKIAAASFNDLSEKRLAAAVASTCSEVMSKRWLSNLQTETDDWTRCYIWSMKGALGVVMAWRWWNRLVADPHNKDKGSRAKAISQCRERNASAAAKATSTTNGRRVTKATSEPQVNPRGVAQHERTLSPPPTHKTQSFQDHHLFPKRNALKSSENLRLSFPMASIGVRPDNLRNSPVTRAQPLMSPGHQLSLVSGKPTLLLKGPFLDRIPPREKVSSRSQLFPERFLLLKGLSLSGQLWKRVHSQHSKPSFGSMDQRSPQPLEGCREVTTVRGQSQSMHFKLPKSDSVNNDNWEWEMIRAKSLDQEKVGGHLVAHSEAWNCVTRDTFVLGSVQGHLIQFNHKPPLVHPMEKCEVQVPKGQQQEMNRQIQTLLKEGNIKEAPNNKGFFMYPFLIPKKNDKSRFIMNLKPLNWYIKCTKFKMTTLKQIRVSLRNGQWAVQMNIKLAYCHVPMHRRHRCFLHFRYKGKVYQFKTLPFGLSTAPKMFTGWAQPILLYCRKLGITLFLYLDNALVLGNTYDQAKTNGRIIAKLLWDLGFVLSLEKCNFEPTQVFTHLGVTWNTKMMKLLLPQDKVQVIQKQAQHVLRNLTCRAVQCLLGLTNFVSIALPLTRLQLRPLQWWLKQHYKGPSDMFKTMPITEEAHHNLEWWCSFKLRPKSIHRPSVQEVVTTDALTKGFSRECNWLAFQGEWPRSKGRDTHINLLELETVWKACNKFESEIKGKATSFR